MNNNPVQNNTITTTTTTTTTAAVKKKKKLTASQKLARRRQHSYMAIIKRRLSHNLVSHTSRVHLAEWHHVKRRSQSAKAEQEATTPPIGDNTSTQATQTTRFRRLVRVIAMCLRWCKWAEHTYRVHMHRYATFAHMNGAAGGFKFDDQDDMRIRFLQEISNQKRLAQTQSSWWLDEHLEPDSNLNDHHHNQDQDPDWVEDGRLRAEMMNFNLDYFRATRRLNDRITNERIKQILSIENVKKRSRKDVLLVEKQMKQIEHMRFVNELPALMRSRFIEHCWIDEYEQPQRVLVAQLRKPDFFYVVVKGTLLCTYKDKNEPKSETVCQIDEGKCFGDLSLLDETVNTVTVSTSSASTQLLVMDKHDFMSIFAWTTKQPTRPLNNNAVRNKYHHFASNQRRWRNFRSQNLEENDDNDDDNFDDQKDDMFEWLKRVSFLKDWPIDSLSDAEKYLIRLYRIPRGRLITPNATSSKFIYIVKTGSVSVWLRSTTTTTATTSTRQQRSNSIANIMSDRIDEQDYDECWDQDQNEESRNPRYFPRNRLLELHHADVLKKLKISSSSSSRSTKSLSRLDEEDVNGDTDELPSIVKQLENFRETQRVGVGIETKRSNGEKILPGLGGDHQQPRSVTSRKYPQQPTTTNMMILPSRLKLPSLMSKKSTPFGLNDGRRSLSKDFRLFKNGEDRLSERKFRPPPPPKTTASNMTTRKNGLLRLSSLYSGDYCGLNDILFDDQPDLQLMSCGCECVLLPKRLFVLKANIEQLKRLHTMEKSYPSFESVSVTLKNYAEWRDFRKSLLMIGLESH